GRPEDNDAEFALVRLATLRSPDLPRDLRDDYESGLHGRDVARRTRPKVACARRDHAGARYADGPKDYEDKDLIMVTIILISTFICIAGGVMAIYWLLFRPVSATAQRLSELDEGRVGIVAPSIEVSGMETLAARLAEPINKLVPPSAADAKKLQRELMQAGYRSPSAAIIYRVTQLLTMVLCPLLVLFVFSIMAWSLNDALLPALFAFGAGFLLPRFILNRLMASRKLRITWGLADALDLMVITMEAGLGLNAAMLRVCEELRPVHPDISKEFELANLEIRVGRERSEALRN